nr:hypothetical protein [Tanacetum cinerariifolium]
MVRCSKCDSIGVIRTSWTSDNPERRFYCCSKRGSNHGFIDWFDEKTCQCSVLIIKQIEDEVAAIRGKKKKDKDDVDLSNKRCSWHEKRCSLPDRRFGLRGGVGLTNVCDWLTVGAEGVTDVCDWLPDGLALAEAEACDWLTVGSL